MTSISDRGLKHTCSSCETRFYDLNKKPATCPKCNHISVPLVKSAARPARRSLKPTDMVSPSTVLPVRAKQKPAK
jgi:hypothetical protein